MKNTKELSVAKNCVILESAENCVMLESALLSWVKIEGRFHFHVTHVSDVALKFYITYIITSIIF